MQASSNSGSPISRRSFLRNASATAAGAIVHGRLAMGAESDYRLEISEIEWELAPKKKIRTTAYNGQIPGPLLRVVEGKPVEIEIHNKLDRAEIVHWHGQQIPADVDGAMEEGSPMIAAGASTRIRFTAEAVGSALVSHPRYGAARSETWLVQRAVWRFSGQPSSAASEPDHDQEQFIVLHDWEPYNSASDDGSLMVMYALSSVNGRMLGHDEPIQVRAGQRVLFQIVNASATEVHWLALPGHRFQVLAMDGALWRTRAEVETLRLGPAERISAMVTMNAPGVWVLGEPDANFRKAGMGTVIEYAGQSGEPQWKSRRQAGVGLWRVW